MSDSSIYFSAFIGRIQLLERENASFYRLKRWLILNWKQQLACYNNQDLKELNKATIFPEDTPIKLEGKIFRGNLLISNATVEHQDPERTFTQNLEKCLIEVCRALEMPIPLWLEKNTREFARFHQTLFFDGQFLEPISFDRFQIRWIE